MLPNETEIRLREMRRRELLVEVARERLIDAAAHRPTASAPATTGRVSILGVARSLRVAVAARLAVTRRWAHAG